MDSLITAAARALAAGDPLAALTSWRCATTRRARAARHRDGAARRPRARGSALRRAARAFGGEEVVAARGGRRRPRSRSSRANLSRPAKELDAARVALERPATG